MNYLHIIKNSLGLIIVAFALFFIIGGVPEGLNHSQEKIMDEVSAEDISPDMHNSSSLSHFANVTLEAEAAYVYDVLEKREIFVRNAEKQLPIASLTKLMTAVVALEHASTSKPITINPASLMQDGESGFALYEQWSLEELLDIMLVSSSNDGAFAVAASVMSFQGEESPAEKFVAAMNEKAYALSLNQTYFQSPTGLDINNETQPSAVSSAKDVTRLFSYIMQEHPHILEPTKNKTVTRSSLSNRELYFENTNPLVNEIPLLIGSKTGFTDIAGGSLVIAFDVGLHHPVIITVLGSTSEGRFTDVEALISATLRYTSNDA